MLLPVYLLLFSLVGSLLLVRRDDLASVFNGPGFPVFPDEHGSGREEPRDRCHMGKGASVPKPNKRQEMLQERLLRAQLRQAQEKVEMPEIPPPLPIEKAPPAPSTSSADALEAEYLEKRKALKRTNARNKTVFAGETGGLGGAGDTLG